MKNKTKAVVALASLLAVTSGIGAYSTFAWFTTTRTAQVNLTSAKVYSSVGKLLVAYGATQPNQGTAYTTTAGTVTDGVTPVTAINATTVASNETDISGSGKIGEFYKPTWIPGHETALASSIDSKTNGASDGVSYYIAFILTFWNKGTAAIDVYYNNTAAITGADTAGIQAAKATRVAVYDGDTKVSVWQGATDAAYKYISSATGTDYGTVGANSTLTQDTDGFHAGAFANAVQKGFSATVGQTLISNLAAGGHKDLTFTSWIEGTATAADNTAIGGTVNLTLDFAALEH